MKYAVFAVLTAIPAVALTAQTPPAAAPANAAAAPAAAPSVGATVTGKDNQPAGTIAQVTAEAVVIDTGTNKVPVPVASIGAGAKGPIIAMTKAELDAAYAQAAQAQQANLKLTPGTMVHGLNDAMLGTIKSADAEFVTVTTPKGDVKLPKAGFGPGANGTVRVNATAEQVNAAVSAAAPAPAAGATTPAPADAAAPATEPTPAATPAPAEKPKAKPKN